MMSHIQFMRRAMALAEKARFHAPPNPWVGCVLVKDNQIIGEGFTLPPGQSHAEICALNQARDKTENAILYVTLEPCAHTGRTPPCVNSIIQSKIREVYVGIPDPDDRVSGKGINLLKEAGIKVIVGICEQEIKTQLTPYLYHRHHNLPFTILKTATSLDGRIAAIDYSSKWITSLKSRQDVHRQRALSQAIVIGSGTALKDSPQLTVRLAEHESIKQPLRVLLDSKGRVPASGPLFDLQQAPTLVITSSSCSLERQKEWKETGAEVAMVSSSSQGINLEEAWNLLGKRSILQVLVEGGATLQNALLETSLVNRWIIYVGSILIGSNGYPFYQKEHANIQQAQKLLLQSVQQFDDSLRLEYEISNLKNISPKN